MKKLLSVMWVICAAFSANLAWAIPMPTDILESIRGMAAGYRGVWHVEPGLLYNAKVGASELKAEIYLSHERTHAWSNVGTLHIWLAPPVDNQLNAAGTGYVFRLRAAPEFTHAVDAKVLQSQKIVAKALENAGLEHSQVLVKGKSVNSEVLIKDAADYQAFMRELEAVRAKILSEGHDFLNK